MAALSEQTAISELDISNEKHTLETALGRMKELLKIPHEKLREMISDDREYAEVMRSTNVFKWLVMVR